MLHTGYLPLSSFWSETDLRIQALEHYIENRPLDWGYRVVSVHFPGRLSGMLPDNPETAPEWWITGEYDLTVDNNPERAITAFSNAIALNPGQGDYYASRARALSHIEPESAIEDLERARFSGTRNEYPNIIEANIIADADKIERLRLSALPPLLLSNEFEGVVFSGRQAQFLAYDSVRFIGRGEPIMQVWYDLAMGYEATGDVEMAIQVYQTIALYSPEDERAIEALERLE